MDLEFEAYRRHVGDHITAMRLPPTGYPSPKPSTPAPAQPTTPRS